MTFASTSFIPSFMIEGNGCVRGNRLGCGGWHPFVVWPMSIRFHDFKSRTPNDHWMVHQGEGSQPSKRPTRPTSNKQPGHQKQGAREKCGWYPLTTPSKSHYWLHRARPLGVLFYRSSIRMSVGAFCFAPLFLCTPLLLLPVDVLTALVSNTNSAFTVRPKH